MSTRPSKFRWASGRHVAPVDDSNIHSSAQAAAAKASRNRGQSSDEPPVVALLPLQRRVDHPVGILQATPRDISRRQEQRKGHPSRDTAGVGARRWAEGNGAAVAKKKITKRLRIEREIGYGRFASGALQEAEPFLVSHNVSVK